MRLVEQHVIDKNDSRFSAIDSASKSSKNLYNAANYRIRQEFIFNNRYICYPQMNKQIKETDEYRALPAKVAQQVLITLDLSWKSYFASIEEWGTNPSKFFGRPRIPGYLDKQGRFKLLYTIQAISKTNLEEGVIKGQIDQWGGVVKSHLTPPCLWMRVLAAFAFCRCKERCHPNR